MTYSSDYVNELLEEAVDGVADVETDMTLATRPMVGILYDNDDPKLVSPIIEMLPNGIAMHFDKDTRIYMSYISAAMFGDTIKSSAMQVLSSEITEVTEEIE